MSSIPFASIIGMDQYNRLYNVLVERHKHWKRTFAEIIAIRSDKVEEYLAMYEPCDL